MEVWFCALAGTDAARHNTLTGTGEPTPAEQENVARTHSTAASTSAPLRRAALRLRRLSDSTGYERKPGAPKLEVQGDLRLPP